jgi:transketolase
MAAMEAKAVRELGQQFRVDSIRPAAVAKSGHPTSGMSAADLMAVLVANHLRYDFGDPKNAANDRLIFSKGHASTLYYAILRAVGAISDEELLTYRKFGSMLEGHPTPIIPWVWASRRNSSTGSHRTCGCSAETARWPRARCGRRSSMRRTTSSTI